MVEFPDAGCGVAVGHEMLRHRLHIRQVVSEGLLVMHHAGLAWVKPRHETRPRLAALGKVTVGVEERDPFASQLIELWGLDDRVIVGTNVTVQIIGDDEQDVLTFSIAGKKGASR